MLIYTDGSCLKNPGGPGGYAFVAIEVSGKEWHISGGEKSTTNNRMELSAVIESLIFAGIGDHVIYSDSMYVINCAKGKWKRKKNIDLWDRYNLVSKGKRIKWVWVKGHSNNHYNDVCDKLAKKEAYEYK